MIKKQVESIYKELHPDFKDWDKGRKRLSWDILTDSLCKSGDITSNQYSNWIRPNFIEK
jgi:hypothetical protein